MESYFARFFESRARTDFEIDQKKRTLLIFTIIALLLSLTLGTMHLLIEAYRYALILFALSVLCIPLLIMIRRGKYYISAVYFTLICYATLSADLIIAGTVLDTGITAFPLIIITSTFLLGPRAAIMNVLLSSLSLALVFAPSLSHKIRPRSK